MPDSPARAFFRLPQPLRRMLTGMSGLELMAYNLDLQARAERLARMEPEQLRVQAVTWARDADEAGLWSLMEAYLVMRGGRGGRVSSRTLDAYRIYHHDLMTWAATAGMSFLRPRPNDGFAYIRHLEHQGRAPSTVRGMLAAARMLFASLRWAGATTAAPFTDVRVAADPVPNWQKRKPYAESDVAKLLAAAEEEEAVIVLLGTDCGLRATEMTTLIRKDVHLGGDRPYLVVTGKREKRQEVPLSRRAERALERWLTMTPTYGPHVLTLRHRKGVADRLQRLCERAGVRYDGRHVHGLRHSAGTKVYRQTGDVLAVRDHLRHANSLVSETYVHYARDEEKAVNRDWE